MRKSIIATAVALSLPVAAMAESEVTQVSHTVEKNPSVIELAEHSDMTAKEIIDYKVHWITELRDKAPSQPDLDRETERVTLMISEYAGDVLEQSVAEVPDSVESYQELEALSEQVREASNKAQIVLSRVYEMQSPVTVGGEAYEDAKEAYNDHLAITRNIEAIESNYSEGDDLERNFTSTTVHFDGVSDYEIQTEEAGWVANAWFNMKAPLVY